MSKKMRKIHWLLLLIGIFCCSACENVEDVTSDFLVGKWLEKESDEIIAFGGTNHCIEFTRDSFFFKQVYWTDALDPKNECNNGYTIYYKGNVVISSNQLIFNGQHTDANFNFATPDCNRSNTFQATFDYKLEEEDVIILNPDEDVYNQIRLERT